MAFLNSTRSTIAVFASLILVALYHQTRLLQSYLSITSTDTETLANLFFGTHLSDLMTSVNNDAAASLPVRKWAYAFLVGGCSDSRPEYRGFLYNVIAAAQRLKEFGSKAEVVLMIQMSVHTNETELPEYELGVLDAMGIRVHYVPKMADPVHEVFYGLVQEKFRILDLAEYSRVLFLDGDIMPLCDLDYLFELSEPESGEAVLKENVVLAWRKEAANAGFFMLKPDKDDFQLIQEVIRIKEEKALPMPFPHWDEVEGWGHKIEAPDFWRSPDGLTGTNWTWHAVFADQGLLYHWTKYVKQSVSLIIHDEVENWSSRNESAYLENTFKRGMLTNYTCEQSGLTKKPSPYRDFVHFTGRSKPWERNKNEIFRESRRNGTAASEIERSLGGDSTLQWFLSLEAAENATNVAFDFSFAEGKGDSKPPVGRFSSFGQMYKHITARAKRNWTHYQ